MRYANLTSCYIDGIYLHGDVAFDAPLFFTEGNLWMGCPVRAAPEEFEYIVSLSP